MNTQTNFRKTFLMIALPISLQQVITSLLNFIDTLMIGGLGESPVAGVGMANKLFMIFVVSLFGIYSGAGIFTAQYWGKKDLRSLHKVMGVMLSLGVIYSFVFFGISILFSGPYLSLFTNDPAVMKAGQSYLRYVSPSFLLTAISFMYAYSSRTIERTKYPMYISFVCLLINAVLNYCLIYGVFGLPSLGVKGAAIATSISRLIEVIIYYYLVNKWVADHPLKANLTEIFSYNTQLVQKILSKTIPVYFNETAWVVGQTVYFIAYGLLGAKALASVQIATTTSDVFSALFVGVASASQVMIGSALGRNELTFAQQLSRKFKKIMIQLAILVSLFLIGISFLLPYIYTDFSDQTLHLTILTTITMALFQIPKNYNYLAVIGILRSGGDTLFCLLTDLLSVWFIGIPMAFLGSAILKLPIYWVVAFAFSEEAIKMIPLGLRVRSGKWANNLVD